MNLQSDTLDKLIPDFVALQGELPNVTKDATNPHFNKKYADLAGVIDVARPLLAKHNFALNHQTALSDDGRPLLITTLWHASGQFLRAVSSIAPEKQTFQGVGSAITYTRRYDGMAIIGLAPEEDDDGNAAGASRPPAKRQEKPKSNGTPASEATPWDTVIDRATTAIAKCETANDCSTLLDKFVATFETAPDFVHDVPLRRMTQHLMALSASRKIDGRAADALCEVVSGRLRQKSETDQQAEETFR